MLALDCKDKAPLRRGGKQKADAGERGASIVSTFYLDSKNSKSGADGCGNNCGGWSNIPH